MTLTKKVGAILLLLTVGSLVGSAAFAIFFARTSVAGILFIASNTRESLLQELAVNVLNIRSGDESVRPHVQELIDTISRLSLAISEGGTETLAGRGISSPSLVNKVYEIAADPSVSPSAGWLQMSWILAEQLPSPPADVRESSREFLRVWEAARPDFQTIAESPRDAPAVAAVYSRINSESEKLNQESRKVSAAIGLQIVRQRRSTMELLIFTGALSILLFAMGLWFTRKYVFEPIQEIRTASLHVREGDYSYRIPVVSNDELSALSRTFNEMSSEINRHVETYRQLFENAAEFIFTTSLEGRFLSVNRAGETITGLPRSELLTMRLDEIVRAEDSEMVKLMRKQLLSGERDTAVAEVEFAVRNGQRVSMETSQRLIRENGRPVAFQGVSRDITERKKLEKQLGTSQKMDAIGRMAGGIAHDFGNVLTIITGYCALILASRSPGDSVYDDVRGIQRAAQRAGGLIRHLLGFSSGQVYRPRIISPKNELAEIINMLRRTIGEDIDLVTAIRQDLYPIRIDPGQLEQIVINLVLNARDSMPGGGIVEINATNVESSGEQLRLTVKDEGTGMSPETLARIFEPFFSTRDHGTGLGLSTVHSIVRQSEGTISVDSELGRGTTFTIMFPKATAAPSDLLEPLAAPVVQRGTETILLVEDEKGVRKLIRDMLRLYGYTVVEAEDQRQAIELCSRSDLKLDLLLTDVLMPNMSGPEMVREMMSIRPGMKIIYMSGHSPERFANTGLNPETDHFIQKPVMTEVLTSKIREVLGK
jgi:PAS domain S-box-containing protein